MDMLNVSQIRVGDKEVTALCHNLDKVKELNLSGCGISSSGFVAIAEQLEEQPVKVSGKNNREDK